MPLVAHRRDNDQVSEVPLNDVRVGDDLIVYPLEICPVDGVVIDGHGVMDESYLTGEPFMMPKAPGSEVFSGAINGENALTLRASRLAVDSRYARIMSVMRDSEQRRPQLRRLGDQLGAWYTPSRWRWPFGLGVERRPGSGSLPCSSWRRPVRCSLAFRSRSSAPSRWQRSEASSSAILRSSSASTAAARSSSTRPGTLTYGEPTLTDRVTAAGVDDAGWCCNWRRAWSDTRSIRWPSPFSRAASGRISRCSMRARCVSGQAKGLEGEVDGRHVRIIGRRQAEAAGHGGVLPPVSTGLECVILVDGRYAATYRFHDAPREDSRSFIRHLGPRHQLERVLLVSGDRESEVRYLAERVGIDEVYAGQTPEEKVAITRRETNARPPCSSATASTTRRRW